MSWSIKWSPARKSAESRLKTEQRERRSEANVIRFVKTDPPPGYGSKIDQLHVVLRKKNNAERSQTSRKRQKTKRRKRMLWLPCR